MQRNVAILLFTLVVAGALSGCAFKGRHEADTGYVEVAEVVAPPALALSATRTLPVPEEGSSTAETTPSVKEEASDPATEGASASESGVTYYRLQAGDPVVINLRGIYPKDEAVEDVIDENGKVTLPHLGDIVAAGKSTSQLESDIRSLYVDGGYYRNITVTVVMPSRTYFIRGEVRNPGRFPVVGGLTIMQAIAAAGGYTEFASPRNVKLIRTGTTQTINMRQIERNPENDIRLESGDVIVVERSIL